MDKAASIEDLIWYPWEIRCLLQVKGGLILEYISISTIRTFVQKSNKIMSIKMPLRFHDNLFNTISASYIFFDQVAILINQSEVNPPVKKYGQL
jgi:hypothetical protein